MKDLAFLARWLSSPVAWFYCVSVALLVDTTALKYWHLGFLNLDVFLDMLSTGHLLAGALMIWFILRYFVPFCHRVFIETGLGALLRAAGPGYSEMTTRPLTIESIGGFSAPTPSLSLGAFSATVFAGLNYQLFPESGLVSIVVVLADSLPLILNFALYLLVWLIVLAGFTPTRTCELIGTDSE